MRSSQVVLGCACGSDLWYYRGDSPHAAPRWLAFPPAFAVARPGSVVGAIGAPHGVEVPIDTVIFRNVGMRGGVAPVRRYIPELLDDVLDGTINPGRVSTTRPISTASRRHTTP